MLQLNSLVSWRCQSRRAFWCNCSDAKFRKPPSGPAVWNGDYQAAKNCTFYEESAKKKTETHKRSMLVIWLRTSEWPAVRHMEGAPLKKESGQKGFKIVWKASRVIFTDLAGLFNVWIQRVGSTSTLQLDSPRLHWDAKQTVWFFNTHNFNACNFIQFHQFLIRIYLSTGQCSQTCSDLFRL